MFKKGDVINAIPPKEYGEWSCLMFTEDAKPVHGNPLKYMGKARPVCQAYQDEPELGRNLFCHSCRHQCPQREYMVKYVGRFEPQEAQPQPLSYLTAPEASDTTQPTPQAAAKAFAQVRASFRSKFSPRDMAPPPFAAATGRSFL